MDNKEEKEGEEEEEEGWCMECLERRIKADYSEKLNFVYGLSPRYSALPFASSAVVQLAGWSGEGEAASASASPPEFIINYYKRRSRQHHCFSQYIDECCLDDFKDSTIDDAVSGVVNEHQAESKPGIPINKTTTLEIEPTESRYLSNAGASTHLHGLGCRSSTCNFLGWYSCTRTITSLAPIAQREKPLRKKPQTSLIYLGCHRSMILTILAV